jgi:hypothetical protein
MTDNFPSHDSCLISSLQQISPSNMIQSEMKPILTFGMWPRVVWQKVLLSLPSGLFIKCREEAIICRNYGGTRLLYTSVRCCRSTRPGVSEGNNHNSHPRDKLCSQNKWKFMLILGAFPKALYAHPSMCLQARKLVGQVHIAHGRPTLNVQLCLGEFAKQIIEYFFC